MEAQASAQLGDQPSNQPQLAAPRETFWDKSKTRLRKAVSPSPEKQAINDLLASLTEQEEDGQGTSSTVAVVEAAQSPTHQEWALALSGEQNVQHAFGGLQVAANEYNVEASQTQKALIQSKGVKFQEVLKVAQDLQTSQSPKTDKTVGDHINDGFRKFSEVALYYSNIFEVLIQQNPQWVSLAWGAMKFLLLIPVEYQKIKESIVTQLGILGDKFKIVQVLLHFFPQANVIGSASTMYAKFAEFLEKCLRWAKDNMFKRIIKATFRPFNTSLKPIIDDFNTHYLILKDHVEAHNLIRSIGTDQQHSQMLQTLQTSVGNYGRHIMQMSKILQGLVEQRTGASPTMPNPVPLPNIPKKQRPQVVALPGWQADKTFLGNFKPLQEDFDSMQSRLALSPVMQHNEGVNILHRDDFQTWIQMGKSSLLWIDGYEVPGRPSWLAEFGLHVIQAALISGYEVLYSFNNLHESDDDINLSPLGLVQRLSGHLLQENPAILGLGDRDLMSPEIFLAAKTDLQLSWRILVECLAAIPSEVIYIVIEDIDLMSNTKAQYDTFITLLCDLSMNSALEDKIVKVMVTSTRPDAGFESVFGASQEESHQSAHSQFLVRVAPAAARSRKERPMRNIKRRLRIPRNSHSDSGTAPTLEDKIHSEEDFVPQDEGLAMSVSVEAEYTVSKVQANEDFDIFDFSEMKSEIVEEPGSLFEDEDVW